MFCFRDLQKNDSDTLIWNELKSSFNENPILAFREFDCFEDPDTCKELKVKFTPSYFVFVQNELDDIYYGQPTLEAMRNFCLTLLGFHVPRSLPAFAEVSPTEPQHAALRIGAEDFNDNIKEGITLVM